MPKRLEDMVASLGRESVIDTGYTKLCPVCCDRGGEKVRFIGRERPIDVELCKRCATRGAIERERRRATKTLYTYTRDSELLMEASGNG